MPGASLRGGSEAGFFRFRPGDAISRLEIPARSTMKRFLSEISYDVQFVKGHKLQPAWFKVLKVFILLGAVIGFVLLFGWKRAAVFVTAFLLLSLIVHLVYRINTRKFTQNWMDFVIVEDKEKNIRQGIGAVYYSWILLNAAVAFIFSMAIR
jgi:hypothetical protein